MKQFSIYQLPVEHAAKFMRLSFVKEHNIMPKLEDYKLVYEGEFEPQGEYSEPDQIYMKFQGEKPEGYTGHSISMSDVVEIDGKYFYCDSYEWEEVAFTSIKEEEAKRYGTTVESLEEQGFIFIEEACGDCHWFASCAEFGGSLMSLAWYREQQKNFRNEHFKKNVIRFSPEDVPVEVVA